MVLSLRSKANLLGVCEANSSKENGFVFAEQSQSSWSLRSKLLKGEWFCLCGAKPIFLEFAKQTPQRRMVLSLQCVDDLPGKLIYFLSGC